MSLAATLSAIDAYQNEMRNPHYHSPAVVERKLQPTEVYSWKKLMSVFNATMANK